VLFEAAAFATSDIDWLERMNVKVFRRVGDLSMSIHECAGWPIALIRMPVPEQGLEAFFIAVVLLASMSQRDRWPEDVQARFFTLERETDDDHPGEGVICEWTKEGNRWNSGLTIVASPEAFLQAIVTHLQKPVLPPVDETTADGETHVQSPSREVRRKKPWWKFW
jgi:hypothetical protein